MQVTVAVVTYNRAHFLPALYEAYARQTYPDTELRILDDSDQPSAFFEALNDPRVHYTHLPERHSIGAKRNLLVEQARGEWICHFDDDDYYAEQYVASMLAGANGVDFIKLAAWFSFSRASRSLTWWDTRSPDALSYWQTGKGLEAAKAEHLDGSALQRRSLLGYGFSYFYRKRVGLAYPFRDVNFGEDYPMVESFVQQGGTIRLRNDEQGLVLHQLHGDNMSTVSPQYRLPGFLLHRLFPGYARYEQLLTSARQPQDPH